MIFKAGKNWCQDGVMLLMEEPGFHGERRVVPPLGPLELVERKPGDLMQPTLELDGRAAQSLMDALWNEGLRPTEAKYPSEHVNALRDHLADMRKLVFERNTPSQGNVR